MWDYWNKCPLTMLSSGGLLRLHLASDDAINWLKRTAMKALTKWNENFCGDGWRKDETRWLV